MRRAWMLAISSSVKPASARDADHDGGRPVKLEIRVTGEMSVREQDFWVRTPRLHACDAVKKSIRRRWRMLFLRRMDSPESSRAEKCLRRL